MKKALRIRKNQEFQSIIAEKKFIANDCFVIYYQPKKVDQSRKGISVGKKMGPAVVRNKIKRQVRAMLRNKDFQNIAFDCIIIVRLKFLSQSYAQNETCLRQLFHKIKVKEGEYHVQKQAT